MKKAIMYCCSLLSVAICMTLSMYAFAYEPLPPQLDGSMMPYDFNNCRAAEVPDSLRPFYIAYLSRHGARYLSSEKKVERMNSAIAEARAAGTLTPLGDELASLIEKVTALTDGRWGALDSVGAYEQQRLGMQMAEMWPGVTKEGKINAWSSYVPRVVMSMYQFTHSLCKEKPMLDIFTAEGHKFDYLLRYFTTDSAYVDYLNQKPWKKEYDRFVNTHISSRPAEAIFGNLFDTKENRKLTLDLYGILQSLRAAGLPGPDTRWMSEEEYQSCWEAANLEHYYARTINPLSTIPAKGAVPLLKDMLSKLTEAIESKDSDPAETQLDKEIASLYFGHAETLMPFLSLCDVEGCNAPAASADNVASLWRDYDVVPLGANFEIVLMSSPSGSVYALTRLNGQNVKVGPFDNPLVKWDVLHDFLNTRIALY